MTSNASIYFADPSLISSKFFTQFDEIMEIEYLADNDSNLGMNLSTPFGEIECNFMFGKKLNNNLQSIKEFVASKFEGDDDDLIYINARIETVLFSIQMNIKPSSEEETKLWQLVQGMNYRLNGLMFVQDSLIDYDGEPFVGPSM